ncbi:AraC family transcriptional regulator [Glaciimonas sp. PCH181]|uniref:AraC family transcriptional regulator n=1 Tax=Glaciimonas sp. PCH181 TaxID=2133943 RepID=UPI000D3D1713|nr:AraC family transcriptional regulator [Glaciimonas sp. PCH181]PUA19241.1 AraC family transcriptional regulator [Glaciimonas sp. PCH181]
MATKLPIRTPELEYHEFSEFLRFLEHGVPDPLIRWHYHDVYELHYIIKSCGKLFVGDYIGEFGPGNLVLTGPRLPHNWISTEIPKEGIPSRDMAIQFGHAPLELAAKYIPEMREIMPLLERAKYGIEFFNMSEQAERDFYRIRDAKDVNRFAEFLKLLGTLAKSNTYRLLSSSQMQSFDDDASMAQINTVFNYITENYRTPISADFLATRLNMSPAKFSRFFRKATGNSFTDFVNQIRVNKACQLLMNSDQYVTNICYEVGFNNVANFNRRFLEMKGITPKEFRAQSEGRFGSE